jgi:competence protein ComEC
MRTSQGAIVLCLAYILGLLATFHPWLRWGIAGLAIPVALMMPRWWRKGPPLRLWAIAFILAILAGFYLQFRFPQPDATDISKFIPATAGRGTSQFAIVQGTVDSYPRVTRNNRSQFWLKADRLNEIQGNQLRPADVSRTVTGKVYVTVPLISTTNLQPGVEVSVTGTLYLPQKSQNPGGFSFQDYLQQSGAFAGMRGVQLNIPDESQTQRWSWGKLRQSIVKSQVKWLDIPAGPLVSAMVMGADAVDVPFDLRDRFVRVGLAHALAASGFQVSLLLNALLSITRRRLSLQWQFNLGALLLLLFLGLTGMQPAVMRSVFMGFAVLIAMLTKRQIEPINSLLMAATILLIINPLTIWDIGFQLSVLATLGLVVSVKPLEQKLDWLPPTIANTMTVPLAAMIWTLPLQLMVFKVFPVYSLLANIVTAPLIEIISIGGMIAAAIGVVIPIAGSAIASLLYYPTHLLIWLVNLFNNLPGTSIAVGQIEIWQLVILYGLIGLVWWIPKWQRFWRLIAILSILIVTIPLLFIKANELQITALAAGEKQVLAIQDRGQTMLINSGDAQSVKFGIIPFFQQQAVNRIDLGMDIDSTNAHAIGWQALSQNIAISRLDRLGEAKPIESIASNKLELDRASKFERVKITPISIEPPLIKLDIESEGYTSLIIGDIKLDVLQSLIDRDLLPPVHTLYWMGGKLTEKAILRLAPQVAIAAAFSPDPETIRLLDRHNIRVYYSGRDGAIQWTPTGEFKPYLEGERDR